MLIEPLFSFADSQPDEIAVVDDRGQVTHAQLAALAVEWSRRIADLTDRPVVGLLAPSSSTYVAAFFAIWLAGKVVVPINFLLGDDALRHIVADSGIDLVLTVGPLANRIVAMGARIVDLAQLPPAPPSPTDAPSIPSVRPDDLAVLMYTSGTAGRPKGVRLSHGNLAADVDACIQRAALQHQHRFLGVVPLFHSFGMTAMMLAPVRLGAPMIYQSRFSAVAALNAIRDHHVSLMFAVPSMFAAIAHLKNARREDFSSIYAMISGGEPQSHALRQTFAERFGVTLYEGYGMTETSPVVALNVPHDHRPGSVGRPVPGAVARIVDDAGAHLPPDHIGEIQLAGPMVTSGYHNLPAETAAAFTPDGFLKTGDLGRLDADGYLHITGRIKEMIIVAGEKASPREIEEILLRHPDIADAAVVGRPDPHRGESIVAFVIPHPDAAPAPAALRDFCRDQGLAPWKCPREVRVVADLPRSPTGKVLKRILNERLEHEPKE